MSTHLDHAAKSAKTRASKETTHFTYDANTALLTKAVTDDGQTTHLCYYATQASADKPDRSDQVPKLNQLLKGFRLQQGETSALAQPLACPEIFDALSPPLLAQCNYVTFPDGGRSDISVSLFGYGRANRDSQGMLIPDIILNLEGVEVDTSSTPWTLTKASGREGLLVSLQQIENSGGSVQSKTETTSTRWYKNSETRHTQTLKETTTVDSLNGTLWTKGESPLKLGALELTAIVTQQIRSGRSGRILRESRQDELGRPTTMVYRSHDSLDRLLTSTVYAWDTNCFQSGLANGLGLAGVHHQWSQEAGGNWVTTTGPDGRKGRTLLDGLQRPVRRELQRLVNVCDKDNDFVCLEEISYGSSGEVLERCTYDYHAGGLCIQNKGVSLSGALRDWFWEINEQHTQTETDGTTNQITRSVTGTPLLGTLRSQEVTQHNHHNGCVTIRESHLTWDNVQQQMQTAGVVTEKIINARGQCEQINETIGDLTREWKSTFDELGRRTKITSPDGTSTTWTFEGFNTKPTRIYIKSPSGQQVQLGQQVFDETNSTTCSLTVGTNGSLRTFTFEDNGYQRPDGIQVWNESSADGNAVFWFHSDLQRPNSKRMIASFTYNAFTKAIHIERPAHRANLQTRISTEVLSPQLLGNLTRRRTTHGVSHEQCSLHSLRGNVEQVQLANGSAKRVWSDGRNRRSRVRRGHFEYRYLYTAQGSVKRMAVDDLRQGQQLTVDYDYDNFGREVQRIYSLNGTTKSRYKLSWSQTGQLSKKEWFRNGNTEPSRTENFSYDKLRNELTHWTVEAAEGFEIEDINGKHIREQAYTYDFIGNLLTCTTTFIDGAGEQRAYAYDDPSHPTQRTRVTVALFSEDGSTQPPTSISFQTDKNGSALNDINDSQFTYTQTGQLLSVAQTLNNQPDTTYEYDESGRLAGQWDAANQQWRVLHYTDDQLGGEVWLNSQNQPLSYRTFDEEAGLIVQLHKMGEEAGDSQTLYVFPDPQNSSAEEYSFNASGLWSSQSVGFTPWGEAPLERLNKLNSGLGYNGQRVDPVTGCYHFGSRFYNPRHQAFCQSDSLSPFENGGLNNLAYCAGRDPVNWHDPSGHIMISRREASANLFSLDQMISETKPPHHEAAAWWEWALLAYGMLLTVGLSVITGGAAGALLLAAGLVSFGLGAAELALRQTNPDLSKKLGWGSLAANFLDAGAKGIGKAGLWLVRVVRRASRGVVQLRNAIKMGGLKALFKSSQTYHALCTKLPTTPTALTNTLDNGVTQSGMTIERLGGNILDNTSILFPSNPGGNGGLWIGIDDFNVKASLGENLSRMAASTKRLNKTLLDVDNVIATIAKATASHALTTAQSSIAELKSISSAISSHHTKTAKLIADLIDAETAVQAAALPIAKVEKLRANWTRITKRVNEMPNQSSANTDVILDFLKKHNYRPACYKQLTPLNPFKNTKKANKIALAETAKLIEADRASARTALDTASQAQKQIQDTVTDIINHTNSLQMKLSRSRRAVTAAVENAINHITDTDLRTVAKEQSYLLGPSLLQCDFTSTAPLTRLIVMAHGSPAKATVHGGVTARVQIADRAPRVTGGRTLKRYSYWDGQKLYNELKALKDPTGKSLINFDDIDIVQLKICHSADGNTHSLARDFSDASKKVTQAYVGELTVNYNIDSIGFIANHIVTKSNAALAPGNPGWITYPDAVKQATQYIHDSMYLRSLKLKSNPMLHDVTYNKRYFFPTNTNLPQNHTDIKLYVRDC
ncbi:RHS repeat domain-containing protein [Pseudomonas sp. X4]|uniref:RHS repeat domain-containing protein n=1 Tax=Pseudomonas sp. X4 TaxID=3231526 RepID=UPI00346090AA